MAAVSISTGVTTMEFIVAWGGLALCCALLGFIFANQKNRDASSWAAWCFLIPPLVIVVMLLSANKGPRPPPRPLDDLDRGSGGVL